MSVKVLMVGDVIGEPGRRALARRLRELIDRHAVDYTVVNVENMAGGFGVTGPTCREVLDLGADVLTSGNHIWDKREVLEVLPGEPRLLRPYNYPPDCPGAGLHFGASRSGARVAVLNLQGRAFLPAIDCPFRAADRALQEIAGRADLILVDMHAEATSEKVAMGWYLDGKVAAVVGTHTHIPTADERVLPGGTAYVTDLGMTGPYDSVIGVEKEIILRRFLTAMPAKFETAKHDPRLCGALITVDPGTGRALAIERVMLAAGPGAAG